MVPSALTKACNLAAALTAFAAISLRIRKSSRFYMAQASFSRWPAADTGLETGLPSAAIPNPRGFLRRGCSLQRVAGQQHMHFKSVHRRAYNAQWWCSCHPTNHASRLQNIDYSGVVRMSHGDEGTVVTNEHCALQHTRPMCRWPPCLH